MARIATPGGQLELEQVTDYPWSGNVRIKIRNEEEINGNLLLRIPGWAAGRPVPSDLYAYSESNIERPTLRVNGEEVALEIQQGYAQLRGNWKNGDEIELSFPMIVRKVMAHPLVEANRKRIALECGPIVYCAEGVDNQGLGSEISIRSDAKFAASYHSDLLRGINVLTGVGVVQTGGAERELEIKLVPYYSWSNRGPSAMSVWLGIY